MKWCKLPTLYISFNIPILSTWI